ncbi:hypothetical protein GCM10027059_34000 [Myceligenerans halotolerans]
MIAASAVVVAGLGAGAYALAGNNILGGAQDAVVVADSVRADAEEAAVTVPDSVQVDTEAGAVEVSGGEGRPSEGTEKPSEESKTGKSASEEAGAPAAAGALIGWGGQNGGVTGGGDAAAIGVGSADELAGAVSGGSAKVVRLSGDVSCSGMIRVGSNTTVEGVSGARLTGCGLDVADAENVIIRNLSFDGWDDDAINIQMSRNVWVDHNTFGVGYDGSLDIKRGSDYVTVSWNHFQGHDKNALLGHSDDNGDQDTGALRVTYHHNWFDGTVQRNPRVRFANPVHVFNNLYTGVSSYGVASTMGAGVLVEGNYFENVDDPFHLGEADSGPGSIVARDNHFVNSGEGQQGGSVEPIPYSYTPEDAAGVKETVMAGAGQS